MRVLLFADSIPPEHIGGAGKMVWILAQGLKQAGHEVHIVAATEGHTFEEAREGIPTYHLHSSYPLRWRAWLSLYNPQVIKPLKQLIKKIQPDVVNAHNIHLHLSYMSLVIAHRMGIPVVFSAHDMMTVAYTKMDHFIDPTYCGVRSSEQYRLPRFYNLRQNRLRYNPFRNLVIRYILRRYVQVRAACSNALRTALEANGLPPFETVYNGFDLDSFQRPSDQMLDKLRQRFALDGRKVVLFGGRPGLEKGANQLFQALDRVIPQVPELLLLVLTTQPVEPSLMNGLQNFSERHLREGGWLSGEELAAAYFLADIITVPSIYLDPLPVINFEAMAARRPLVSTCYGGSPEIIIDGETGYIINPYDTAQFANRLTALLLNPELSYKIGEAGYQHLRKHFLQESYIQEMLKIYEKARAL